MLPSIGMKLNLLAANQNKIPYSYFCMFLNVCCEIKQLSFFPPSLLFFLKSLNTNKHIHTYIYIKVYVYKCFLAAPSHAKIGEQIPSFLFFYLNPYSS